MLTTDIISQLTHIVNSYFDIFFIFVYINKRFGEIFLCFCAEIDTKKTEESPCVLQGFLISRYWVLIYAVTYIPFGESERLYLLMLIKLCKTALGGFAVLTEDISSRMIHRFDDEVEGYLAAIGKEVGEAQ